MIHCNILFSLRALHSLSVLASATYNIWDASVYDLLLFNQNQRPAITLKFNIKQHLNTTCVHTLLSHDPIKCTVNMSQ